MNFGDLKTYVVDVLGRSDIPEAAYVLMQDDVTRRLKLQGDQASATLSSPYTLPADFLGAVEVRHNDVRLDVVTTFPDYVLAGSPDRFKVSGGAIQLWPSTTEDIALIYSRRPTQLQDAADTNVILERYWNVAIYGALFHTCVLLRDADGKGAFEPMYTAAISQALSDDQAERFGGGLMVPTPREVA